MKPTALPFAPTEKSYESPVELLVKRFQVNTESLGTNYPAIAYRLIPVVRATTGAQDAASLDSLLTSHNAVFQNVCAILAIAQSPEKAIRRFVEQIKSLDLNWQQLEIIFCQGVAPVFFPEDRLTQPLKSMFQLFGDVKTVLEFFIKNSYQAINLGWLADQPGLTREIATNIGRVANYQVFCTDEPPFAPRFKNPMSLVLLAAQNPELLTVFVSSGYAKLNAVALAANFTEDQCGQLMEAENILAFLKGPYLSSTTFKKFTPDAIIHAVNTYVDPGEVLNNCASLPAHKARTEYPNLINARAAAR